MAIMKEFKEFAMRGPVIDLAVGVIIGAAFGKIISTLVENVLMPPIGILIGGVDFSKLSVTLKDAVGDKPAVIMEYGIFFNAMITFVIVAFCIFMVIKALKTMRVKKDITPDPSPQELLLREIRDLLKSK
ncbi:MAG TPA: large-conductance mechanosensitive channel protein MscL [Candidatus Kapabacteria bacterium]